MRRHIACSLAALVQLGLLAAGCGSSTGQNPSTAEAGSGGSVSGGSTPGGSTSGGSKSSGGGSSGGSKANGGAGGGNAGCHDAGECPIPNTPPFGSTPYCLSPGQTPPAGGCGAPMWCGECSCPPMPQAPAGSGTPCQSSADCPAPSDIELVASVCHEGFCARCGPNSDCPAAFPICSNVVAQFIVGFRTCMECATDQDCAADRPYCLAQYGIGQCVACRATADCAVGVCEHGVCTPGCGADKPCTQALTECKPELRCGALSCTGDPDCPVNTSCVDGGCTRRRCESDAECEGNCVNDFCYETLGTCYTQLAVP